MPGKKRFIPITILTLIVVVLVAIIFLSRRQVPAPVDAHANPILGMWRQYESDKKTEIMFNEDYTGFVFDSDTLFSELSWRQDDCLSVHYSLTIDSVRIVEKHRYNVSFLSDTLLLHEIDNGVVSKFGRVR